MSPSSAKDCRMRYAVARDTEMPLFCSRRYSSWVLTKSSNSSSAALTAKRCLVTRCSLTPLVAGAEGPVVAELVPCGIERLTSLGMLANPNFTSRARLGNCQPVRP